MSKVGPCLLLKELPSDRLGVVGASRAGVDGLESCVTGVKVTRRVYLASSQASSDFRCSLLREVRSRSKAVRRKVMLPKR